MRIVANSKGAVEMMCMTLHHVHLQSEKELTEAARCNQACKEE